VAAEITLLFSGLPASADKFAFGITTVALLRVEGRIVVFDTGPYAYRPILLNRLRRLGVEPAEVDTVILSHLHWDSASNADIFSKADIVVHERELAYAGAPDSRDRSVPGYIGRAIRKLRLKTVSGETELAPGLRILELPGHTPGSIGLLSEDVLLAGDAVTCAKDAVAKTPSAFCVDPAQAARSLTRALEARIVYPGHDRPFFVGPPVAYVSDYTLRIRLFVDPAGQDEELRFGSAAAKSFATWPDD